MGKAVADFEDKLEQKGEASMVDLSLMSAMVEFSPEPMLLADTHGNFLYVNEAMCQLVGRDKDTLLQIGREGVRDLEDPRWWLAIHERQASGFSKRELFMMHQDGTRIPVEIHARTFAGDQQQTLVSVHVRDKSEYYVAQQLLRERTLATEASLQDLQLVLDHSADLICTFDLNGNILQINKACETILGYTQEEVINQHYSAFIFEEDIEITQKDTAAVTSQKITNNFRNRYRRKDGSLVHLSWSSSLSEAAGRVYCIARDVTEVMQLNKVQQESEERLQALLHQGSDMIAVLTLEGNYTFASSNSTRILGITPEGFIGRNAFEFIHPDFHQPVMECLQKVLQGEIVDTTPFLFKDGHGEWRWLESHATNCADMPSIQGIIVNSRDISERRKAELELEESNQRYKALFDYNPDAVYSMDAHGYYTSANEVALKLFGLTQKELLEKHMFDFATPDILESAKADFNKVLSGHPVSSEASMKGADNEDLYLSFTEIPIIINGEVVGVHGIAKDITAPKKQQLLQEATAKRLNTILESIKDAFFTIDKDWRFTYINQEFDKIMAVDTRKWIGRRIIDLYDEREPENKNFYDNFQQAIDTQKPQHFEQFASSVQSWLDVSVYPSEEGLSIYFKEITDRKNAEAELKKLSWVASKTVNSVYITDEQARIEWVNDGFTRITGYTLEEMKGQRPGDLLAGPETAPDQVREIRDKLQFEEPFVQEVQNRNKQGELYWSKLDVTPILDEQGGGKKFIVIETVITDQKKAEQERIQLTEELLRRNRNLEQFTYIVSHNLRSPVANILGLTALFKYDQDPESQLALMDRLKQTAQNLDTIIRDLNDLLSLQGEVHDAREVINLRDLVEQVLQVLPNTTKPNVQVNLNGIEEIRSARSYVSSILSNLVSNAVKYKSPERSLKIAITAEQCEDMFCFTVTDNGLGINLQKEQNNLFGLYKRFHFHVSGKGLGLYLVKTQAEALGGYVTVESTVGQGSSFKVCIKHVS
ncbi:PAS domain S-box protein [Nibribacter koreensis]|uniref:histidine kinase n=1 Tax=Nibribacter koreensis TaxID=1084519 RepID=A0ABP8FE59_9BACT